MFECHIYCFLGAAKDSTWRGYALTKDRRQHARGDYDCQLLARKDLWQFTSHSFCKSKTIVETRALERRT